MAVCKLFDERPVWPRQSLYERLLDDGVQVSQSQFKRLYYSFHSCRLASSCMFFGMSFKFEV